MNLPTLSGTLTGDRLSGFIGDSESDRPKFILQNLLNSIVCPRGDPSPASESPLPGLARPSQLSHCLSPNQVIACPQITHCLSQTESLPVPKSSPSKSPPNELPVPKRTQTNCLSPNEPQTNPHRVIACPHNSWPVPKSPLPKSPPNHPVPKRITESLCVPKSSPPSHARIMLCPSPSQPPAVSP
ncbi:MAG: hypothetical protein ACPGLY_23500, partial [Rubripirellula sp.]